MSSGSHVKIIFFNNHSGCHFNRSFGVWGQNISFEKLCHNLISLPVTDSSNFQPKYILGTRTTIITWLIPFFI